MTRAVVVAVALLVVVGVAVLALVFASDTADAPTVVDARAKIEPTPPRPYAPLVPDLDALARMPKPTSWPWEALKECETPGLGWDANTGNGFSGGLQFAAPTWLSFRPAGFPAAAWQATRAEQIAVAARVLRAQGWARGWPRCSRLIGAR